MTEEEADHGAGDEADEEAGDDAGVRPAGVFMHGGDEDLQTPVGRGAHEEDAEEGDGDDDPAVEEGQPVSETAGESRLGAVGGQAAATSASLKQAAGAL